MLQRLAMDSGTRLCMEGWMISKPGMANILMIIPSAYWLICGAVWIITPDV